MRMKQIVAQVLILSLVVPNAVFAADPAPSGGKACPTCGGGPAMMPTHVSGLDKNLEKILTATSCPGMTPADLERQESQCQKDFACNMIRSAINVATVGGFTLGQSLAKYLSKAEDDLKQKDKGCLDTSQGDCATNIVAGAIKDIWLNLEGIGMLAKAAGNAAVSAAKAGYNKAKDYVTDTKAEAKRDLAAIETATDKTAVFVGTLSTSKVKQFLTDAGAFMKDLFKTLYKASMDFVKKNFGCAKWSGVPHASKCLEPFTDLTCANCSQQANMMCGAIGVLVSEGLLMGFLITKGIPKGIQAAKKSKVMAKIGASLKARKAAKAAAKVEKQAAKAAAVETAATAKAATTAKASVAKVAPDELFKVDAKPAKVSKAEQQKYVDRYVAEVEDIKASLPATMAPDQKELAAVQKLKELEKKGLKQDEIHKLYDDAAAAAARQIDYTVNTSYLDGPGSAPGTSIRAEIQSRYSQQVTDLKEALKLEDPKFADLAKTNPQQADDFVVHTLKQMENNGMKPDAVKARVHKAINECAI